MKASTTSRYLSLSRLTGWRSISPAWQAAAIATLGCSLPLLLGLFTAHIGFLWAATGAFQASLANPFHRFGMLRMLLLILLGAASAGLGFWSATHPLASLLLFGGYGYLLAWLQRHGTEAGKLGVGLAVCLCLGQGQHGAGGLHNGMAVAALFAIGGLWVMFLAFGARGLHGLRMWPALPRWSMLRRSLRRHARRLPLRRWLPFALVCSISAALGGAVVELAHLPRGYWLTITVFASLQLTPGLSIRRVVEGCIGSLLAALVLGVIGHSLQNPREMVMIMLPLIFFGRAFLANHYGLFVLQNTVCFVMLVESLAKDWHLAMLRLENSLMGAAIVLAVVVLCDQLLRARARRQAPGPQPSPTDAEPVGPPAPSRHAAADDAAAARSSAGPFTPTEASATDGEPRP